MHHPDLRNRTQLLGKLVCAPDISPLQVESIILGLEGWGECKFDGTKRNWVDVPTFEFFGEQTNFS